MSELGARDGPVQCTRSRTKEDNEYPALALEKKSRNSPGFYKILAASNFHTYSIVRIFPADHVYVKQIIEIIEIIQNEAQNLSRTSPSLTHCLMLVRCSVRNRMHIWFLTTRPVFFLILQEIPGPFWKTYSKNLWPKVKLQGIWEESAVRTVTCSVTSYEGQIRVFLRTGWKGFSKENNLEVGQELLFTLVGDSFFTVREVLANGEETQSQ